MSGAEGSPEECEEFFRDTFSLKDVFFFFFFFFFLFMNCTYFMVSGKNG